MGDDSFPAGLVLDLLKRHSVEITDYENGLTRLKRGDVVFRVVVSAEIPRHIVLDWSYKFEIPFEHFSNPESGPGGSCDPDRPAN